MSEKLKKNEIIITAFSDTHTAPGYYNHTVRFLVMNIETGTLRLEWLQPDEFNSKLVTLHKISRSVNEQMVAAVYEIVKE